MKKLFAALCLLTSVSTQVFAAPGNCAQFSPGGAEPVLTNAKLAPKTRDLCFSDFAVLHSGITHSPLWSAEHLTRDHLLQAKEEVRTNKFYAEPALPPGEGATLQDFLHSGYDRGHMSPAGDRWNDQAMAESFSLGNMVMQHPANNRKLWAHLESFVRKMSIDAGESYVVTGPLFLSKQITTIGPDHVFVPSHLFKVVYIPSQRLAFAVVAENVATDQYDIKTVHELEALSGIRFPGIPEQLKDTRIGGLRGV